MDMANGNWKCPKDEWAGTMEYSLVSKHPTAFSIMMIREDTACAVLQPPTAAREGDDRSPEMVVGAVGEAKPNTVPK